LKHSIQLFCEEPFRLFFPVGLTLGIVGVSLWPLYYAGLSTMYPATAHARLMIEGFMASFIIGFLGTAGPRITATRHFSRGELITLLTLDLFSAGLHSGGSYRAGDILFIFCLASFLFVIGKRFIRRRESPPPNFALVALGLLNGFAGALLLALFENEAYSLQYRIGASLLEQGLVLLPILGVAPFLLARLLDLPSIDGQPESRALPPGWITRAIFAAAVGVVIDLTFISEAVGVTGLSRWVRLGAIVVYLIMRMPWRGHSFLGNCLRIGIISVVAGVGVEALWPLNRIGALHLMFVGGFSFIVLTVATRVVFGHSGNAHLFRKRLPFFIVVGALIFLAMLSRYVADLAPKARTVHLIAAAISWLIAVLIWMGKVIPKVAIADLEE
jgi:uncharacterized protein involved in response to NO